MYNTARNQNLIDVIVLDLGLLKDISMNKFITRYVEEEEICQR
ncbi:hypothetical protein HS7_16050 [Sulfolobales archaeon HS-7]|nr:hypothetical protein HS7_16050 [Sulfolobales archaeon HS-7]